MRYGMLRGAGLRVTASTEVAQLGSDVLGRLGPFVAPCRVVYVVDEPAAAFTAACRARLAAKKCSVRYDPDDDAVYSEVIAFSEPATWWSRLSAPCCRWFNMWCPDAICARCSGGDRTFTCARTKVRRTICSICSPGHRSRPGRCTTLANPIAPLDLVGCSWSRPAAQPMSARCCCSRNRRGRNTVTRGRRGVPPATAAAALHFRAGTDRNQRATPGRSTTGTRTTTFSNCRCPAEVPMRSYCGWSPICMSRCSTATGRCSAAG